MIGLEGQCKGLRVLVDAGVEDPAEIEVQPAEVSSRVEKPEAEKPWHNNGCWSFRQQRRVGNRFWLILSLTHFALGADGVSL
jgi:hypothetical protein